MEEKTVYMIQRSDGLYSTGGEMPSFTKKGKVWNTEGSLKAHLNLIANMMCRCYNRNVLYQHPYSDCVIKEFKIVTEPKGETDFDLNGYLQSKVERIQKERNGYKKKGTGFSYAGNV